MTRPPTVSDRVIAVAIGKSIFAYIVTVVALLIMIAVPLQEPGRVDAMRRLGAATGASIILLPVIFGLRSWRRHGWNILRARRWGLGLWMIYQCCEPVWWEWLGRGSITKGIQSWDTEFLLGAYHAPDHTLFARQEIKFELLKRGVSEDTIKDWLPPPSAITIPRVASLGQSVQPIIRACLLISRYGVIAALSAIAIAFIAALALDPATDSLRQLPSVPSMRPEIAAPLGFFLVASLISAAAAIGVGLVVGVVSTHRILLLRPFGRPQMTRPLKRVVVRHLAHRAHVYTLSDRSYRPNTFGVLWNIIAAGFRYLVGIVTRPSFRVGAVSNEPSFIAFASRISDRLTPSIRKMFGGGQACNIKTSDQWWRHVIDVLIHSADIIVMDISRVGGGSAWEIVQLDIRNALDRTIFIAEDRYAEGAFDVIDKYLPEDIEIAIHVYGNNGRFIDQAALNREIDRLLLGGRAPKKDFECPET